MGGWWNGPQTFTALWWSVFWAGQNMCSIPKLFLEAWKFSPEKYFLQLNHIKWSPWSDISPRELNGYPRIRERKSLKITKIYFQLKFTLEPFSIIHSQINVRLSASWKLVVTVRHPVQFSLKISWVTLTNYSSKSLKRILLIGSLSFGLRS